MNESIRRVARSILATLIPLAAIATLGVARVAWGACVEVEGGVGGTGVVAGQDARGGTPARGGVGGTGFSDDAAPERTDSGTLGVVGVITQFASVCVNGLEIHYDDGTPTTVNGRPARTAQLALGQVVAVEAMRGAGRLSARSIDILKVLEGPVTRSDPAARTVFVMGQAVRVTDETRSAPGQRLAALKPGALVQVSGYRNARGEILASRIDTAPALSEHSAIGRMRRRDAGSSELEGGLIVSLADARLPADRDVLVRGKWDGERLRARDVAVDPSARLLDRVERAVVESLVRESRPGESLRVGQFQVRISRSTRIEGAPGALEMDQRVRVTGATDRRRGIAAERIEIQRSGAALPGRGGESGADRRSGTSGERERIDNSGPGRPERPDRLDNSGPGRVERPERIEREGSNSGRH
jgi:uncharacterized protein DUF5666